MKLTILHLSDVHIRGPSDLILTCADKIASTCFSSARESDGCLIIVTGDIAFSGQENEYALAKRLLEDIKKAIKDEGFSVVDIIVVPGNHDCWLVPENRARTVVIEKVIADPQLANDESIIDVCTVPQNAFFKFQKEITQIPSKFSHKFWLEYELALNDKLVRISGINAAWMSRIPEQPGQLVYPVWLFQDWLEEPSNLRLVLLHHPLNWYAQHSYHPLRKAIHTHADAVLSGHEHFTNSGEIIETGSGQSLFFEAAALQPDDDHAKPGFSILVFDLNTSTVGESRYELSAREISPHGATIHQLRSGASRIAEEFELTQEFQATLRDPGGNFTHADKDEIELDDVFVYPDLRELSSDQETNASIPADVLLLKDHKGQYLLFMGDDQAGKSTLILRAFREYHSRGLVPLYISASEFSSVSDSELEKKFQRRAKAQYAKPQAVNLATREQRIALVDDIDHLPGGPKVLYRVLQYLEKHHSCVILSAGSDFELTSLVSQEAVDALKEYQSYEIRPFGHRLRHQLIKKWCISGRITTKQELDKRVHEVEEILNAVVGKTLVPSQPIYLLILLQACEQQQQGELQNSSFAYYYQYLITKSLKEAGLKPERLNELFNYLAHLAWFFKASNRAEVQVTELREFNRTFSERFTSVDLEPRLDLLYQAKILSKRGDCYSFTYPYVYFLFVGKYLADNLHKPEIKSLVTSYCAELDKRENAHSILFLTHHQSNTWVIEQVSSVLKECFSDQVPMRFEEDLGTVNKLIDSASQLLLNEPDVEHNQVEVRKMRDEFDAENSEDRSRGDTREQIEFFRKINVLMRTAEILGQILKNYYGSLERPVKEKLLDEVLEGPLRVLSALLNKITNNPESLVKELEVMLDKDHPNLVPQKKKEAARRLGFHLLGMICTGMVARTAQFIGAEKLREDISTVVQRKPTNAYRLIEAATRLIQPGYLPIEDIRTLAEDLEPHVFAFTILQSLAAIHLYLFHTRPRDKQKLCKHLKIALADSRTIDVKSKKTKLLKR